MPVGQPPHPLLKPKLFGYLPESIFNEEKYTFKPETKPALLNAFQALSSAPDMRIEIQGHTNSVGSAESNQRHSEARANAVRNYLSSIGMDADRDWLG